MVYIKLAISKPGDGAVVARAALITIIACCSGGGVVLFIHKLLDGAWSYKKVSILRKELMCSLIIRCLLLGAL